MPIYYVQYEASPAPDSDRFNLIGGAYVNCWINAASEPEALDRASQMITENGWCIAQIEDPCQEVSEHFYSDDDEGLEHYKQAVLDGECYVFHQWPVGAQEEDSVH